MKNEIQVHDERSLAFEDATEGKIYAYAPASGSGFFFICEDTLNERYKCSFTEDFAHCWKVSDLESGEIL